MLRSLRSGIRLLVGEIEMPHLIMKYVILSQAIYYFIYAHTYLIADI